MHIRIGIVPTQVLICMLMGQFCATGGSGSPIILAAQLRDSSVSVGPLTASAAALTPPHLQEPHFFSTPQMLPKAYIMAATGGKFKTHSLSE